LVATGLRPFRAHASVTGRPVASIANGAVRIIPAVCALKEVICREYRHMRGGAPAISHKNFAEFCKCQCLQAFAPVKNPLRQVV
jgi:hypothetical protein